VITFDANIYISALQYGGKPMALLEYAMDGRVQIAVSEAILTEVHRTLGEKFSWSFRELKPARAMILSMAKLVEPSESVAEVHDDPADNRILECALASGSTEIVTGDKDLLRLKVVAGVKIIAVSEFFEQNLER
jgi:uncharacterized protein